MTKKDPEHLLHSAQEITANVIWRTLQLCGYIDQEHSLTPWGIALATSFAASGDENFDEALIWAFELVHRGALKADTYSPNYSGGPVHGSEADRRHALLISRVAGLLQLRHGQAEYKGPVSRNLLSFNSFVKKINQALCNLSEAALVSMLLNNDATRFDRKDWYQISTWMPFAQDVDVSLAVVLKVYFEELADRGVDAKQDVFENVVAPQFQTTTALHADLQRVWKLWDVLVEGLTTAEDQGVFGSASEFKEASKWLESRRV